MSDTAITTAIIALASAFIAFLGTAITAFLGYMSVKLNSIQKTGEAVHVLTNNKMGVELKLVAELSRWKANLEKSKENEDAAILAEKNYANHQAKQGNVDPSAK